MLILTLKYKKTIIINEELKDNSSRQLLLVVQFQGIKIMTWLHEKGNRESKEVVQTKRQRSENDARRRTRHEMETAFSFFRFLSTIRSYVTLSSYTNAVCLG
jgi:hypothetical protein